MFFPSNIGGYTKIALSLVLKTVSGVLALEAMQRNQQYLNLPLIHIYTDH